MYKTTLPLLYLPLDAIVCFSLFFQQKLSGFSRAVCELVEDFK